MSGRAPSAIASAEVGGLPYAKAPHWVRALDWARQHLGYRLRIGQRLGGTLSPHLPPTLDTKIFPGIALRLDLRQQVAVGTWWSSLHYEAPTPHVIREWLQRADRFFDFGANYGWYSYLALACSRAEVHAFEPTSSLIAQMDATKAANRLDRFYPHQLGVSDRHGELLLHLCAPETSYSTFGPHPQFAADEGVMVPVVAFDQWLDEEGIPLPDQPSWVLKIDTEGYETKALRGMTGSLRAQAFLGIAIELNQYTLEFCGSSTDEVEGLLAEAGYVRVHHRGEEQTLNRFFVPR